MFILWLIASADAGTKIMDRRNAICVWLSAGRQNTNRQANRSLFAGRRFVVIAVCRWTATNPMKAAIANFEFAIKKAEKYLRF